MAGAPPRSTSNFALEDKDLDDADLWAVIDSAAASRKPLLSLTNSASPLPPSNPRKTPRHSDGEVVQEEHRRSFPRPQKMARFAEMSPEGKSGAVVRQQSPRVSFPSPCASPEKGGMAVREMSPVFETSPVVFGGGERAIGRHSLAGPFPSVSLFRQYQSAAVAILDKSDYTVISGNPFIKKTGWRKISFYFNLSFEIKDKTIEYDDNRNVLRAEFVARAYMQGGRFCDGWGSCERHEKRFQKPNHDIPSTAETRAKNKACQDLLGIGACRPGTGNGMR